MRILLIGEYSRLHNSLKEALISLGHQVDIIGNGDGFKNFPVDYNIDAKWSKRGILNVLRQGFFKIFKYDFAQIEYATRFNAMLHNFKDYDVVQLISETPIQTTPALEWYFLKRIKAQNNKVFLLSSGTDVQFLKAVKEKKYRYSLMDPYFNDRSVVNEYRHVLQNLKRQYQKHHQKVYQMINGVIATDLDYAIALKDHPKFIGMIPNPVAIEAAAPPAILEKIVIFHGINRWNYHKKGNAYFEEALKIIKNKYAEKVEVLVADTLPYNEYITSYNTAHILLDQVFAYDQGYNALEAMSKGKVVFTGAEKEFDEHYQLTARVAVNALPDVDAIVSELSYLIEHPEEITAIGKRAIQFVENEHHSKKIAALYLKVWNEN